VYGFNWLFGLTQINIYGCSQHTDFPNVVAERHIFGWGCATRGRMTPKFELSLDFCTMHLFPSFIILCLLILKLSCWQTSKQTNKRRWKLSNTLRYATTLRKYCQLGILYLCQLRSFCSVGMLQPAEPITVYGAACFFTCWRCLWHSWNISCVVAVKVFILSVIFGMHSADRALTASTYTCYSPWPWTLWPWH